jgi:putative PIN family toxin of toxin-antitoxin system
MNMPRVVIDTNVFIAALLSQRGAAHQLLLLIDQQLYQPVLSVPLTLEYEDVGLRMLPQTTLSYQDFDNILDYVVAQSERRRIHFLWRPFLKDPKDDMVLELAVAAQCETIITFNTKDFAGVEQFGIMTLTPYAFLQTIGQLP